MKVIGIDNHPADSRVTLAENGIIQTLSSRMGTGGGNTPMVLIINEPIVLESNQNHATITQNGVCPTLPASMGLGGGYVPMITERSKNMSDVVRRLTPIECERLQGFPDNWTLIGKPKKVTVTDYDITWETYTDEEGEDQIRVLSKTPIGSHEEERYYYVDSDGKEKECTDSNRYKALGNSIALPQWWWLENKMKPYLPEHATLGSLFSGIGGFDLTWECAYGPHTAKWESEIEPFPIAVCRQHFGDEDLGIQGDLYESEVIT